MSTPFKPILAAIPFGFLSGCFGGANHVPVNLAKIKNMQIYEQDRAICEKEAKKYSLTTEALTNTGIGAIAGGSAVAGVAIIVAGTITVPALPFVAAGTFLGGVIGGSEKKTEEKKIRTKILKNCLVDKGYEVH